MGFFSRLFGFFKPREEALSEPVEGKPVEEISEEQWHLKSIYGLRDAMSRKLDTAPILEIKNLGEKKLGILMLKYGGIHLTALIHSYSRKDKSTQVVIATREKGKTGRILRYTSDDFVCIDNIPDHILEKARQFADTFKQEKAKLDNLKGYKLQKIDFEV